ncbi:hypothetical protein F5Y15DRAFT_198266 [Xylariaceae sp. FL0016]|nr:hypothetical protein F5Y15DRAFT_198266 [Xylariaceae sp. FL0016]
MVSDRELANYIRAIMAKGRNHGPQASSREARPSTRPCRRMSLKFVTNGRTASDARKNLYLAEVRDMTDEMPHPAQLASLVVKLYRTTESPTNEFGFHVTTGIHQTDNSVMR